MGDPGPVNLPPAVATLLAELADDGRAAHVVGRSAHALAAGETPLEFTVATPGSAEWLLARFPRAVPVDPTRSRLMLPSAAGPIDLLPYPADAGLDEALARCDFRLHAIAIGADGAVHDPFDGLDDARRGRLRCVGAAAERFRREPLAALRALRLVATRALEPDAELLAALPEAARGFDALPAARLRGEMHALLLGAHVQRALETLRASGLESRLADGVADDAALVVAALPADLELRLAAWLRGARAVRALRRLREPRDRLVAVERMLHLHPIDAIVKPSQDGRVQRLLRRSGERVPGLLALREAELVASGAPEAARRELERLREAFDAARRRARASAAAALALDGEAVMAILECRPGPEVGRALDHLAKCVAADPSCNTPEALRERLLAWRADAGG